ncbi:MAG TPA: RNA polymerase sigma factor [Caulobacteraceae bacterium]|nr:RNA polymerase sigma factor [Caulobacteraceae bacterium]
MAPLAESVTDARARWLSVHALQHEPALRAWLSSRRLPGLEIDDIIQETYARLIQAESLESVRAPKAYIFQTAWSVLVSHVRRERVVNMQALADVDHLAVQADAPSPEQQTADRDELLQLAEAIAVLPGKIGDVFRLRRVQGLSQKAVAVRLGLAESTVEKHMRRGLMLLLEHFTRGGYPPPQASKKTSTEFQSGHGQAERKRDR